MGNSRYPQRWTPDEGMREISGFGGGYELACWAMLRAGGEWADARDFDPEGITSSRDLPKEMQDAMIAAAEPGGATGAMFGTVASHIIYVLENNWNAWVDRMREDLRAELAGGTELRRG